jgi:hypothetical protein
MRAAHVRVIPYDKMFGRPTGNARHLTDPANKIYYATMEEGIYEIDVRTLEVTELWADEHFTKIRAGKTSPRNRRASPIFPGYHGKGFLFRPRPLVYANNGEHGAEAPTPRRAERRLATWDGKADLDHRPPQPVHRSHRAGRHHGNANPATDPIWSIGWDHRSLILMLLDGGGWRAFRLPKASHSYDGAHGWNTEWPRIREIGERRPADDHARHVLAFSQDFFHRATPPASRRAPPTSKSSATSAAGTTAWCSVATTRRNEFLNKRKAKGEIAAPQSQSNLWFVEPARLDQFGPALGRGAVWLEDEVSAATPSEPFLFSGFDRRALHLAHDSPHSATITLEVDVKGNGRWSPLRKVTLQPREYVWLDLTSEKSAAWVRLTSDQPLTKATAWFHFANKDNRPSKPDTVFDGLAAADETKFTGGIVRALDQNRRTLHFAAMESSPAGPRDVGLYELDAGLKLRRVNDAIAHAAAKTNAAIPVGVLSTDAASVIFTDDSGRRWRLPKGDPAFDCDGPLGPARVDREVVTERDLFNAHGTFYELPAENAGGFAKIRPITTHNRRIVDYCSYRGLLILSGVAKNAPRGNPHILRSDDGQTALWAGVVDDLWKLGKPRGIGGPWHETKVVAHQPSEPYLMTGYDKKTLKLSHQGTGRVSIRAEVDVSGTGLWRGYRTFSVPPRRVVPHRFPAAFQAYWIRLVADEPVVATATFVYE